MKRGVLLEEGFVTVKLMEHNMSVMEHRMESWTNRMSTKRYLATSASRVQMRVYSVDSSIDYTCPYCIQTFARFSEAW